MSNYEKMTKAELCETADALGIMYEEAATKAELLSAITAIVNGASDEPQLEQATAGPTRKGEDRVKIVIAESERDKQPVQVGVNGTTYLIKRGAEVSVPKSVVEVLKHATQKRWNQDMTEYATVLRYNFQVVV